MAARVFHLPKSLVGRCLRLCEVVQLLDVYGNLPVHFLDNHGGICEALGEPELVEVPAGQRSPASARVLPPDVLHSILPGHGEIMVAGLLSRHFSRWPPCLEYILHHLRVHQGYSL